MIEPSTTNGAGQPELLDQRWKELKTTMYKFVQCHKKTDLILGLIKLREKHTIAPTLSEITYFTGFDVAIHTISGWNWEVGAEDRSLEADVNEIGLLGAELMVVHTLRESIKNGLLTWDGSKLSESEIGERHFQAVKSFNVEITGSRTDVAKKRFVQGRLNKQQRKMDPVNKLGSVKRLYWENSILMLLRAPLPFYRTMSMLSIGEREYLIKLNTNLIKKSEKSDGLIKVRLRKGSNAANVLLKLIPNFDDDDRRPSFVCTLKNQEIEDKLEFQIGIGSLSMFVMFLLGFDKDHLDEKAQRAEQAVREVIEASNVYEIVESNTEVTQEKGEVITEIDILARSKIDADQWITIEVKDFSFWKGWIWGAGSETRKEYYLKAIEKLPIKEEFICNKHSCSNVQSFIVTSVPEPFYQLNGVKLVYLSDLTEELIRNSGQQFSPRKRHTASNFLVRYFLRLKLDYENAEKLVVNRDSQVTKLGELKQELNAFKEEYEKARDHYRHIVSDHDTLLVSEKLMRKRLVKDTGERHYQIEQDLNEIKAKISRNSREKNLKAGILRELKDNYSGIMKLYKSKDLEVTKIDKSIKRLLASRIF